MNKDVYEETRERTNVKVGLNDDLLELTTDSGDVWWTVVDTLQHLHSTYISLLLNVKRNNDYSVQNDESLRGHCTNERRARKRDKKSEKRCD